MTTAQEARTAASPASHTPAAPFSPCLPLVRSGKVRDVYRLPPDADGGRLLMVASDRVSAFDVIMPTPMPGKGVLLTKIASWWFGFIERNRLAQTHVLSTDVDDVPAEFLPRGEEAKAREYLRGRITIGRECRVIPVECVVRGYLEGSGWKEYQQTGEVCGVKLPRGLKQCEKLPEPIFTPATKADVGHDENISFDRAAEILGNSGLETMTVLRDASLAIYNAAAAHALSRGLIIADTKFEFGIPLDDVSRQGRAWVQPMLIDEALTPDSSRFWPADTYKPGGPQKSFDKQFLREFLEEVVKSGKWDKTPPGPELPSSVVEGTLKRYREAGERLCG